MLAAPSPPLLPAPVGLMSGGLGTSLAPSPRSPAPELFSLNGTPRKSPSSRLLPRVPLSNPLPAPLEERVLDRNYSLGTGEEGRVRKTESVVKASFRLSRSPTPTPASSQILNSTLSLLHSSCDPRVSSMGVALTGDEGSVAPPGVG